MKKFDRKKFRRSTVTRPQQRGLVIYYYGDGKGKTTAAVGLAVRARGAGMRVCMVQFMKTEKWQSHERSALRTLGIPVHVLGSGFVGILDDTKTLAEHKRQTRRALTAFRSLLHSNRWDVLIGDELGSAVDEGLCSTRDVLQLIKNKPPRTHIVLTGHSEYPSLLHVCDLATKMVSKKHPYATEGRIAQRGIDF